MIRIPQLKKKLVSFISEEEGKIAKHSLLTIGALVGGMATISALSQQALAHTSSTTLTYGSGQEVGDHTSAHGSHGSCHSSHGSCHSSHTSCHSAHTSCHSSHSSCHSSHSSCHSSHSSCHSSCHGSCSCCTTMMTVGPATC